MWLASTNEDNYNRYAEELFELASEQLPIIGTVGFAPLPVIVSNQVGDFPRDVRWIGDDTRFLRDAKPTLGSAAVDFRTSGLGGGASRVASRDLRCDIERTDRAPAEVGSAQRCPR